MGVPSVCSQNSNPRTNITSNGGNPPHDCPLDRGDVDFHRVGVPLPGTGDVMDAGEWLAAVSVKNALDRNVAVVKALGFGQQVLTNAEHVLRI